jgi:nitrile hydratase accessory protein
MSEPSPVSDRPLTVLSPAELRIRAIAAALGEDKHVDATMIEAFSAVYTARIGGSGHDSPAMPGLGDIGADVPDAAVGARVMVAIPRDEDGPIFQARWEVLTFVVATMLQQRGAFAWPEWAEALGAEIRRGDSVSPGDASGYFAPWLAALERLVLSLGLSHEPTLARYRAAFERAAARTPEGAPVILVPDDMV